MKNELFVEGAIPPLLISEMITGTGADPSAGAVSVFVGRVRNDVVKGHMVKAIEYSAYKEMAEKENEKIIETVKSAFSDVKTVSVFHSLGVVRAGEASLFVLVTAGHRDQATRACRHTIEMIKESLPVWKKELFDENKPRRKQ